jgi:hypothetical protein
MTHAITSIDRAIMMIIIGRRDLQLKVGSEPLGKGKGEAWYSHSQSFNVGRNKDFRLC